MMVASGFDALVYMLGFAPAALLIVLALLSFVPSKSGFKSDLILSIVSVVGSVLLTSWIALEPRKDHLMPSMWFVFPAPGILGLVSLALWRFRSR